MGMDAKRTGRCRGWLLASVAMAALASPMSIGVARANAGDVCTLVGNQPNCGRPTSGTSKRLLSVNITTKDRPGKVYTIGVGDHLIWGGNHAPIEEGYIVEVTLTGVEKVRLLNGTILPMPAMVAVDIVEDTKRIDRYWGRVGQTETDVLEQAAKDRLDRGD